MSVMLIHRFLPKQPTTHPKKTSSKITIRHPISSKVVKSFFILNTLNSHKKLMLLKAKLGKCVPLNHIVVKRMGLVNL